MRPGDGATRAAWSGMRAVLLLGLAGLTGVAGAGCQVEPRLEAGAAGSEDGADIYEETAPQAYCGTLEPSEGGKLAAELAATKLPELHASAAGGVIEVYVHVIAKGAGRANGDVPDAAIIDQIKVLDGAFASTGWKFHLASIDHTTNPRWFTLVQGTSLESTVKQTLRKGTARDLNLFIADPGQGTLGYATLPAGTRAAPFKDGVVMLHSALPGGSLDRMSLGDQTVHQVGHWLGLYHTYQPDCGSPNGDYVNDTAATDAPGFGCPVGRDTCGDDSSDDPVRNYMDSSDDACMNTFTAGQKSRIDQMFNAYRRF